jgi:hypothetical protein
MTTAGMTTGEPKTTILYPNTTTTRVAPIPFLTTSSNGATGKSHKQVGVIETHGALRCDEIEIETIKIKTKSKSNLF